MNKYEIEIYETTRRTQIIYADNEKEIHKGGYIIEEDKEDYILETDIIKIKLIGKVEE